MEASASHQFRRVSSEKVQIGKAWDTLKQAALEAFQWQTQTLSSKSAALPGPQVSCRFRRRTSGWIGFFHQCAAASAHAKFLSKMPQCQGYERMKGLTICLTRLT